MYRITVNGVDYTAPDLTTLQQWVDEGRVLPTTQIYSVAEGRYLVAQAVPGLRVTAGYPRGYPSPHMGGSYTPVPNNLVLAIFSTMCCCLPFGVVAIVYAAQVDGHARRGDQGAALASADKAKNWAIASIVCGLIAIAIQVVLMASKS